MSEPYTNEYVWGLQEEIRRLREHNDKQREHIRKIERCRREERAGARNRTEELDAIILHALKLHRDGAYLEMVETLERALEE